MEHENNQIIGNEEEILVENQLVADDQYYEYVEVDETNVDAETKEHIYIEEGEEVGINDGSGHYMGMEMVADDQYYEGEEQIDEQGNVIRIIHERQQGPPGAFVGMDYTIQQPPLRSTYQSKMPQYQLQGLASSNNMIAPQSQQINRSRGLPQQRFPYGNYHNVSPSSRRFIPYAQQSSGIYQQMSGINSGVSLGNTAYKQSRLSSPMMVEQAKINRNYYESEIGDVKPPQSYRGPAYNSTLVNISNTAPISNSPITYPRALTSISLRDSYSGSSILTSFLGSSKAASKLRKASSKKKPCNCTKSMCLKLYCDCFANGEFCLDCNCKDCHNNLEHESERSKAIKSSLERNPSAFKPKIGVAAKVGRAVDMERLHQKGCHCKKSNCLKNYCECYEAKVPCTDRCKCCSCRNTEHDRHHKFKDKFSTSASGLAQLAAAAAADARSNSPFSDDDDDACGGSLDQPNPKTQPWFYLTEDVIEAITMCLVAQAQEMEQNNIPEQELEQGILQEFGRCLEQIIENAKFCQQAVIG